MTAVYKMRLLVRTDIKYITESVMVTNNKTDMIEKICKNPHLGKAILGGISLQKAKKYWILILLSPQKSGAYHLKMIKSTAN